MRTRLLAARRARDTAERRAVDAALGARVRAGLPGVSAGDTVCAYVAVGGEPGTDAMLAALREQSIRVLLPITPPGPPTVVNWATYDGPDDLRPGRYGLREPSGESVGQHAITEAAMVLVPALACDRRGARLGRGAGYYDRTLARLSGRPPLLVGVVHDDELLDEVPTDDLDVGLHAVLTPSAGLVLALP
ncbi:5-formyltetrahydrofolate cyclo-ligase [Williamsia sp. CHRR-6]|nr:5-formyltetrahydrofolate cyclo-ligase [Williamsia sp. CHRR-6]